MPPIATIKPTGTYKPQPIVQAFHASPVGCRHAAQRINQRCLCAASDQQPTNQWRKAPKAAASLLAASALASFGVVPAVIDFANRCAESFNRGSAQASPASTMASFIGVPCSINRANKSANVASRL